jgi:hypothetical protein
LLGRRHKDIASQWESWQETELVGDFSSIPEARRDLHECWKFLWDPESLRTDPNAPPVNGEQPHIVGPRAWLTDAFNRVLEGRFHPTVRDTPPVVREFITGLSDPWSIAIHGRVLYISERTAHRISKWDADTGEFLGVLLQGLPMSTLVNRFMNRTAPLADIRANGICVGPEDLQIYGDDLYFGSGAMAQIIKVNLLTGERTVHLNISELEPQEKRGFVKFQINQGITFYSTWALSNNGFARAYMADGRHWDYSVGSTLGYPSSMAVDLAKGRIYLGSSAYGLTLISLALPTDAPIDSAKFSRGKKSFEKKGLHITHAPVNTPWPTLTDDERYYVEWAAI